MFLYVLPLLSKSFNKSFYISACSCPSGFSLKKKIHSEIGPWATLLWMVNPSKFTSNLKSEYLRFARCLVLFLNFQLCFYIWSQVQHYLVKYI